MQTELERDLRELHDDYVFQVNSAIEEGREDVVEVLDARYPDDAARLIARRRRPSDRAA
jgi:hypothetical protein